MHGDTLAWLANLVRYNCITFLGPYLISISLLWANTFIFKITNLHIPAVETCQVGLKVLASTPCVLPFLMIKEQAKAA